VVVVLNVTFAMKKKRAKNKSVKGSHANTEEKAEFTVLSCSIQSKYNNPEKDIDEEFNRLNWSGEEDELISDPGI